MYSLLKIELYKLFHQKSLISLFIIVLFVNAGVFYYTQATQAIPLSAYDHLQKELSALPNEKRYEAVTSYHEKIEAFQVLQQLQTLEVDAMKNQDRIHSLRQQYPHVEQDYGRIFQNYSSYYTGSLDKEIAFLELVQQQMDTLHSYASMLTQIQDQAKAIKTISIFSDTESFSTRNIQKTAQDFQKMESITPIYQLEKGLYEVFTFPFSDFLILIVTMAIVSTLILEEKEKGLLAILRTCRWGEWHTCLAKGIVMMIGIGFLTFLLCGLNLVCMSLFCDLGDLDAPLISLASFSHSTLRLSIQQFLLLFVSTKWLAACAIGAMMLWISVIAKHKAGCFLILFMILGIELACYLCFYETGPFQLFKQINLITFLKTTSLYERYLNINFFSYPISLQTVAFICLLGSFLVCIAGTCRSYQHQQDVSLHALTIPSYLVRKRMHACSTSIYIEEAYKLFWVQKGAFLLIGFVLLQGMSYHERSIVRSQEEQTWIAYMERIDGFDESQITSFLASQTAYYAQLEEQVQSIEEQYQHQQITRAQRDSIVGPIEVQLYGRSTFEQFKERFAYVQEDQHRCLMTPFAYERLWLRESPSFILSILFLFLLLLCCSDMSCVEYHHDVQHLLMTTRIGRYQQLYYKLLLGGLTALLCLCIAFLPELLLLYHTYGFPALTASITSLPQFAHLPTSLSILGFSFLLFLFRLLAAFVLLALLFLFSSLWKTQRSVLCILFLLLFVPLCLSLVHFPYLDAISVKPLLCASLYLSNKQYLPFTISFLLASSITLFALFYVHHHMVEPKA